MTPEQHMLNAVAHYLIEHMDAYGGCPLKLRRYYQNWIDTIRAERKKPTPETTREVIPAKAGEPTKVVLERLASKMTVLADSHKLTRGGNRDYSVVCNFLDTCLDIIDEELEKL